MQSSSSSYLDPFQRWSLFIVYSKRVGRAPALNDRTNEPRWIMTAHELQLCYKLEVRIYCHTPPFQTFIHRFLGGPFGLAKATLDRFGVLPRLGSLL